MLHNSLCIMLHSDAQTSFASADFRLKDPNKKPIFFLPSVCVKATSTQPLTELFSVFVVGYLHLTLVTRQVRRY